MSWFPSGLSNLTDQLSSFTKDVLSEGREEIDDPATELRIIKSKYDDLQNVCSAQRAELDRLKHINEELSVQVQTQELQIRSNSDQYRQAMEAKEKELKALRESYAELLSVTQHNTPTADQPALMSSLSSGKGYRGGDDDFDDVISSQHEINRLGSEVKRLETELRHWRSAANSQTKGIYSTLSSEKDVTIEQLKAELDELRKQLTGSVDRHQSELTALEQVHRQTLSSLKRNHRETIDNLQKQISNQPQSSSTATEATSQGEQELQQLREKLKTAEQRNVKLEFDLEHIHAADRRKAAVVDELTAELSTSKHSVTSEIEKLSTENKKLEQELKEYRSRCEELETEMRRVRNESKTVTTPYSYEELTKLTETKQAQISELQNKIENYEQELEQFDLVKSDWQIEKESLEKTLMKMREQLREKEEAQNIMVARKKNKRAKKHFKGDGSTVTGSSADKGLMEAERKGLSIEKLSDYLNDNTDDDDDDDDGDVESQVNKLTEQIDQLMRESRKLEIERDQLMNDKERLVKELEQAQSSKGDARDKDISALLNEKEIFIKELEQANQNLSLQLKQRESELESANISLNKSKGNTDLESTNQRLSIQLQEKEAEFDLLSAELASTKAELSALVLTSESSFDNSDNLSEVVLQLEARLKELKEELAASEKQKKALEVSLEELDQQHEQALAQVIKSRSEAYKTCEELKVKVVELETEMMNNSTKLEDLETSSVMLAEKNEALESLTREVKSLTAEKQAAEMSLEKLLKEKEGVDKELQERTTNLENLSGSVKMLNEEKEELQKRIKVIELENSASRSELERLRSEAVELRNKIKTLESNESTSHSVPLLMSSGEGSDSSVKSVENISAENLLELQKLRNENTKLKETLLAVEAEANLYETETERLLQVEEKYNEMLAGDQKLSEIEKKYNEAVKNNERLEEKCEQLVKTNTRLADIEMKYEELVKQEGKHGQLGNELLVQTDKIKSLEIRCSELSNSNAQLLEIERKYNDLVKSNQDMKEIKQQNENLLKDLSNKDLEIKNLIALQSASKVNGEVYDVNSKSSAENTLTSSCSNDSISNDKTLIKSSQDDNEVEKLQEEITRLKKTVTNQEDLISTLNGKYSSMLKLLEGRSASTHGNNVLVDFHKLENEAQSLRREKEHMISVLNEKTREASSLKGEVHKLMSTLSASKAALNKLQSDPSLQAGPRPAGGGANEDMKQDAIKQLSQLIRDKDLEIEALQQKNTTLLQVLSESSPDMTSLVSERDEAVRQVTVYQSDREQLIQTLTSKHNESVAFYNETQRLNSVVNDLNLRLEQLEINYRNLSQQYEEKQSAYVKALNDLATLRRSANVTMTSSGAPPTTFMSTNGEAALDDGGTEASNENEGKAELKPEELKRITAEKDSLIKSRDEMIKARDSQLSERETELARVTASLRQAQESLIARETELTGARKQLETLTFNLTGLKGESDELRREKDELIGRCTAMEAESRELTTANSKLKAEAGGRDYELSTLRDRVASMGDMLRKRTVSGDETTASADVTTDSGEGMKSEVERLMKELEESDRRAQELRQERDHLAAVMQHLQSDCAKLHDEVMRLREKEARQTRELGRLREHLVEVEEGYTREALEAEEREKQLRTRLSSAEERLSNSTSAVTSVRGEMGKQIESLQVQLHVMAEQRDNALLQLSSSQETVSSYAASLANLQMVLEQFQAEKNEMQSAELEQCRRELDKEHEECDHLRRDMKLLNNQLEEAMEALNAAHRLSEQIDKKEEMVSAMRDEVQLREAELSRCEEKIRELTTSTDAKVDKIIIKNLLLGYFHTPQSKRAEAFQVITQVLSFNHEEMKQITESNNTTQQGWLSSIFRRRQNSVTSDSGRSTPLPVDQSFSELFVNFLERESVRPPPQARLPAEKMAEETQRQVRKSTPPFNPFAVPMHSTPMPYSTAGIPSGFSTGFPMNSVGGAQNNLNNSSRLSSGAFDTNPLLGSSYPGGSHGNPLLGGGGSHGNPLLGGGARHGNWLIDEADSTRTHPFMQGQVLPVFAATSGTSSTLPESRGTSSSRSTPTSGSMLREVLQLSPSPARPNS